MLPEGSTGHIDPHDAAFLWDLIEAIRPEFVVEIGTAAGVSSRLLAEGLRRLTPHAPTTPAVHTYDLHPWCYFDRTKPIGFAIGDIKPDLSDRIQVHIRATSRDAGSDHQDISFVFIDADHRHPAPALDALALLPAVRPGAWIALHDIRLPELAERHRDRTGTLPDWADQTGPQRLYDEWPFDKLEPDRPAPEGIKPGKPSPPANTGAIRIPDDTQAAAEALRLIANRGPREVEPHPLLLDLLTP